MTDFGRALIEEAKRRLFGESFPRLRACLDRLPDEALWRQPNDRTPSAGQLVVHLCGNARQWIVSGLGGAPDVRDRAAEFSESARRSRSELLELVERTRSDVAAALDRLDPADLLRPRPVQVFTESGLSILVHVVEHVSYHVGQITYVVKSTQDVDLGYYAGRDLNRRASEGAPGPGAPPP